MVAEAEPGDSTAIETALATVGGDNPEALDEALTEALAAPSWRPAGQAVQLVFLVADAPPQIARDVPTPYTASMLEAAERGVKIFLEIKPVGAVGWVVLHLHSVRFEGDPVVSRPSSELLRVNGSLYTRRFCVMGRFAF